MNNYIVNMLVTMGCILSGLSVFNMIKATMGENPRILREAIMKQYTETKSEYKFPMNEHNYKIISLATILLLSFRQCLVLSVLSIPFVAVITYYGVM